MQLKKNTLWLVFASDLQINEEIGVMGLMENGNACHYPTTLGGLEFLAAPLLGRKRVSLILLLMSLQRECRDKGKEEGGKSGKMEEPAVCSPSNYPLGV